MATPQTDDPLVGSDSTVGFRSTLDYNTPRMLKREALLFDQILIPFLDVNLTGVDPFVVEELGVIRDIGIIRDVPRVLDHAHLDGLQDAIIAETGIPFDVIKNNPDMRVVREITTKLNYLYKTRGPVVNERFVRTLCVALRDKGINVFPILETRRQSLGVFPSGTAPVLEVILKAMPIPDDETPWEDIVEFRRDPESRKRLRALRVWLRNFAKGTTATSLAEMKEEIEVHLDEYEEHMKLHRMKVNKGAIEALLTMTGKLAEDLVKVKFGDLARLPFMFRERKIGLLEAEAKAPNRELAYISIARCRFSR